MSIPDRVVFDCNVYFQTLIGPDGPAAKCFELAQARSFQLFTSEYVLVELLSVCNRPHLVSRFKFTPQRVSTFVGDIRKCATMLEDFPHVFDYPRDSDDEHYIDLAAACQAHLIASRDRDLLALNDITTVDGQRFRAQFPDLLILNPEQLLARIGDA
jgi:putative PIN family toxin of toxin-antitoxin system